MKANPIQFGITREDSRLEALLVDRFGLGNMLAIASGGCTALELKSAFPELKITLFDFNPAQLNLIKDKIKVINSQGQYANVINEDFNSLGNFESLFNIWRHLITEFILHDEEIIDLFQNPWSEERRMEILAHPYWPVSFDLALHESMLKAMFGEAAIQHAPRGTYPRYFQKAFEKGLMSSDYQMNPFLQHLFLGKFFTFEGYLKEKPRNLELTLIQGLLQDVPSLHDYDLVHLSNIFDWMDLDGVKETAKYLNKNMKSGAFLLLRQINNNTPFEDIMGPGFAYEKDLSEELLSIDRSLFYSKITVLRKV